VPPSVEIRGGNGGQHEKAEDHALRGDHLIQKKGDRKQRKDDPQFLVDPLKRASDGCSHNGASKTASNEAPSAMEQLSFRLEKYRTAAGNTLEIRELSFSL
jgi:hypothetical protein